MLTFEDSRKSGYAVPWSSMLPAKLELLLPARITLLLMITITDRAHKAFCSRADSLIKVAS